MLYPIGNGKGEWFRALEKFDAMFEPAGYPILGSTGEIDRDSSALSWDNSTRTLTISPTGSDFSFYSGNKKYVSAGASYQITDTEGLWFFYFDDNGDFVGTQSFDLILIYNQAFTAFVYWDATNKQIIGDIFDERHGAKMDGHAHAKIHEKWGTEHRKGGALNSLLVDQSGNDDTHAQFGVDSAIIYDEDIIFEIDAILSTTGIPILYLNGNNPDLRIINNSGFPVATTGSGRLAYNQNVAGTWQLTEVGNNDYVFYHIFMTSGPGIKGQVFSAMGQNEYPTLPSARLAASTEIKNLISILPIQEKDWIATVIFQTSDSYSNSVKARIRDNGTTLNPDWLDWRFYDYKDFKKAVNE